MRCTLVGDPFDDEAYRFEPKLDGVRILAYADEAGCVRLQSRSGADVTSRYAGSAAAVEAVLAGAGPAVMDGELTAAGPEGRPEFATLLRKERPADVDVAYHVFDLLLEGSDFLLRDPLEARREILADLLAPGAPDVRVVDFLPAGGVDAFHAAVDAGFEGVVAKRSGSCYHPGRRTRDWLKVKRRNEADLVVGAWIPGRGELAGTVGALVVGAYDDAGRLRCVGKVGTGFTREDRDALRAVFERLPLDASPFGAGEVPRGARFVGPRLVVEVAFHEITEGMRLRTPSFAGVKLDKPPRECRLSTKLGLHVTSRG